MTEAQEIAANIWNSMGDIDVMDYLDSSEEERIAFVEERFDGGANMVDDICITLLAYCQQRHKEVYTK